MDKGLLQRDEKEYIDIVIGPIININYYANITQRLKELNISKTAYKEWSNKEITDTDFWKKIIIIYIFNYNESKENRLFLNKFSVDLNKNKSILEIGFTDFKRINSSKIDFYKYIAKVLETTPTKIFKERIDFIKKHFS